jgi:hypothetical protein
VYVATPPFSVPVPSVVAPSMNVTVPVVVVEALVVTVAVNITEEPNMEGFVLEAKVVVVVAAFTV